MAFNPDGSRVYNTTLPQYNTTPQQYNTTLPQYAGSPPQGPQGQPQTWTKPKAPDESGIQPMNTLFSSGTSPIGVFNEKAAYSAALKSALRNGTYTNPTDIYKSIYADRQSKIDAYKKQLEEQAAAQASQGDGGTNW